MKNNVHIKINKVNTNIKMCLHHALCFWLGHTDGYSNHAIRINVLFYWWEDGRKSWKQCIIIQFTKRVIHSFRRPLGKAVPGRRWSGFRSAAGAVRCRRAVRDPGWTYGLRCSGDRRAYRQNFCRSCRRVRRNRLPHRDSRRRWGSGKGSHYHCLYKCIRAGSRFFRRTRDGGRGRLRRLFSGGAECPRVLCSSINIHRQGRGRSLRKTLQIQNRFPARLRVNVIQFIRRAALVGTLDHVVADGHDLENAEDILLEDGFVAVFFILFFITLKPQNLR